MNDAQEKYDKITESTFNTNLKKIQNRQALENTSDPSRRKVRRRVRSAIPLQKWTAEENEKD